MGTEEQSFSKQPYQNKFGETKVRNELGIIVQIASSKANNEVTIPQRIEQAAKAVPRYRKQIALITRRYSSHES
jgi:hypothetical protein